MKDANVNFDIIYNNIRTDSRVYHFVTLRKLYFLLELIYTTYKNTSVGTAWNIDKQKK